MAEGEHPHDIPVEDPRLRAKLSSRRSPRASGVPIDAEQIEDARRVVSGEPPPSRQKGQPPQTNK